MAFVFDINELDLGELEDFAEAAYAARCAAWQRRSVRTSSPRGG